MTLPATVTSPNLINRSASRRLTAKRVACCDNRRDSRTVLLLLVLVMSSLLVDCVEKERLDQDEK